MLGEHRPERFRNGLIGVGQMEKDKRISCPFQLNKHNLRERTGLTFVQPAGTLEAMSKLLSANPGVIK